MTDDATTAAKLVALTALAQSLQKAIESTPERMTGDRTNLIGCLGKVVDSVRLLCLPSAPK